MKDEAVSLRRELDRIGTRRGRCVSAELKLRASAWIVRERGAGRAVSELAHELGIASGTVLRWSSETGTRALVPVRVVPDVAEARTVAVVSPSGFRIEGVTLSEAARLLRELG
jgi:transposase-like protein